MKPGIKTTELWLTIIVTFLLNVGAIPVPDKYQWLGSIALVAAYAISRGLAKDESFADGPALPIGPFLPHEPVDPLEAELEEQRREAAKRQRRKD